LCPALWRGKRVAGEAGAFWDCWGGEVKLVDCELWEKSFEPLGARLVGAGLGCRCWHVGLGWNEYESMRHHRALYVYPIPGPVGLYITHTFSDRVGYSCMKFHDVPISISNHF
jgi:hypothetical protein